VFQTEGLFEVINSFAPSAVKCHGIFFNDDFIFAAIFFHVKRDTIFLQVIQTMNALGNLFIKNGKNTFLLQ
jgi:hypothetical protein